MLDAEITPDEFDSSIKNLKKEKSAGPDTVLNEFIINAPNAVKVVLLHLFNRILSMEYFPATVLNSFSDIIGNIPSH